MSEQQPNPAPSTPPPAPSSPTPAGSGTTGLDKNVAGLLCYVLGWVTGIIFIIIEKKDSFVRFHAVQSIVFSGAWMIVVIILSFIPIIGWILDIFLYIFFVIMWILLMYRAYQGQMWKLPIAGDIAEKNSKPSA
jgi:uncharacterized membrane protein